MSQSMPRGRILSGMRPTGDLHLGHLLGALQNWSRLQDEHECFYMIADWHALTSEYADTSGIPSQSLRYATGYLASGIDPERSTLFVQSAVKEHAELHLLLSMVTPLGWLERVPTYKEQIAQVQNKDLNTYGFLGYPVLQAADILLYRADTVPVGEDQVSHLELIREITRRFNGIFRKEVFPEPQPKLTPVPRLLGLDARKMSNSYGNFIPLAATEEETTKKVKGMFTDPARKRKTDPGDPDICNVFTYHKLYTPRETVSEIDTECRRAGIGCTDCKSRLAANLNAGLATYRDRHTSLEANPDQVRDILREGAARARAEAAATMESVRDAVNLGG